MVNITKEQIEEAISKTDTMKSASVYLNLHFTTFKRYALKFDLYNPTSQLEICRRGGSTPSDRKIPLDEILKGNHPSYLTSRLSRRLREEGVLEYKCFECGIEDEYNGKPITLELDHINGINYDHKFENLRFLCPNCHSQTDNFKSKNIKRKGNQTGD